GDLRINYLITSSIEFQSKGVGNGDTIGLFRIWLSFRSSEWMRNPEDQAQSLRGRTGNILQMEKEQIWIRWGQQKLSKKIELEALLRCLCSLANGYKLNRASTGVVVLSKWKKRVPHTRNSYPSLNCLWIVGVLKTAILRFFCWFNKLYEQFNVCDHNRRVGILEAWLTTEHNVLVVSTRDLWLVSLNQSQ
ncbi:hypothetical protein HID58_000687, partial [Brassica napus]